MLDKIELSALIKKIESKESKLYKIVENNSQINQQKILDAFRKLRISTNHFVASTGYGYDDVSRDKLAALFAEIFKAESAIVSPLISSGTQAISITLFGLLTPNNSLLSITGQPYDTLKEVILKKNNGSLKDYLVNYFQIELDSEDKFDIQSIKKILLEKIIDVILITRSKGYSWGKGLSIEEIRLACETIKKISQKTIIVVDNCYGEFVEDKEPVEVGADVVVGSLIKNPGGGIAPTGGYIVGKEEYINKISQRLTAPGVGKEIGSYFASYLPFYEGLFLAPAVVANALKASILFGAGFSSLGFEVNPRSHEIPTDIIRAIKFNNKEMLIDFIQSIQKSSPIDSFVKPLPWKMPGYGDEIIMAAGNFIQGSSIELSADAPIREPYIAYLQGGLTYEHAKIAFIESISNL